MRRRDFLIGVLLAAYTASTQAQQRPKVYRLVVVDPLNPVTDLTGDGELPYYRGFFERLRQIGFAEGRMKGVCTFGKASARRAMWPGHPLTHPAGDTRPRGVSGSPGSPFFYASPVQSEDCRFSKDSAGAAPGCRRHPTATSQTAAFRGQRNEQHTGISRTQLHCGPGPPRRSQADRGQYFPVRGIGRIECAYP